MTIRRRCAALLVGACCFLISNAWPLTTGPGQPEFKGFAPAGKTEYVDLFTGDFQYNILAFELPGPNGGYSFHLGYRSGISVEDEASWIGLGWNMGPAISRSVRGLPDDFLGKPSGESDPAPTSFTGRYDKVRNHLQMLPSNTYGLRFGANYELFGGDFGAVSVGVESSPYYNTRRGFGLKNSIGLTGSFSSQYGIGGQVGIHASNEAGVSADASLSVGQDAKGSATIGYNAISGLQSLTLSGGYKNHTNSYTWDFSRTAELPDLGFETSSLNVDVAFKGGGEVQGSYINLIGGGFLHTQRIIRDAIFLNAFGYMNLERAGRGDVLDFNREKEGPIHETTPNLGNPILTHDVFIISADGLGGSFRVHRTDVPVVYDRTQESYTDGVSINAEFGFGTWAHGGVGEDVSLGTTTLSRWDDYNEFTQHLGTVNTGLASGPQYERYYFKLSGEQSRWETAAGMNLGSIGGDTSVRPTLSYTNPGDWASALLDLRAPVFHKANDTLVTGKSDANPKQVQLSSSERMPRGTLIEAFTRGEIKRSCTSAADPAMLRLAPLREFCGNHTGGVNVDNDAYRREKDHHIGGFRVTRPDGTRFIFGLAVYNIEQEEHEVAVARDGPFTSGQGCLITEPTASGDAFVPASSTDKHLRIRSVGPYATAYLLTAVLGPDYVDIDGVAGPSDADLGYWVAFRYERKTQDYQWRAPLYGARFALGYENGTRTNDRGTFTWGRKELWFMTRAETRTHEAVFDLDDAYEPPARTDVVRDYPNRQNPRRDARGVSSKVQASNSALGQRNYALKRVTLRAKGSGSAAPIKVLNFIYDYSLSNRAPNTASPQTFDSLTYKEAIDGIAASTSNVNNRGKLTLRRLEETYANSLKGRLNAYEFSYAVNPPYATGAHDRWGAYRDPPAPTCSLPDLARLDDRTTLQSEQVPNAGEPDEAKRSRFASAWNLTAIREPSGRVVSVDYEMDDYAYVQDKVAAARFPLVCPGGSCQFGDTAGGNAAEIFVRVRMNLDAGTSATAYEQRFRDVYLAGDDQVYFHARVGLGDFGGSQTVSGHAQVAPVTGVTLVDPPNPSPATEEKVFKLTLATIDGHHPIRLAAWQHLRLQQPDLLVNLPFDGHPEDIDSINAAASEALKVLTGIDVVVEAVRQVMQIKDGFEARNVGKDFSTGSDSWIRLAVPIGTVGLQAFRGKYGGGARVRRILVNDAWDASTGNLEPCMKNGWVYTYRLRDGTTSSGVAAYEPMDGGEENVLRRATLFTESLAFASDYNLFYQGPINEGYYPAPVVGYSRVVVESASVDERRRGQSVDCVSPTAPYETQPTTGVTVHEFYTAKDFPVRGNDTDLDRKDLAFFIPIPLIGMVSFDDVTLTQGYNIVLNDMHGKPKRVAHFAHKKIKDSGGNFVFGWGDADESDFVRRQTWHYKTDAAEGSAPSNRLSSLVAVLKGEGATETNVPLGRTEEFFVDARQHEGRTWTVGLKLNVDVIAAGPIPFPVLMPWLSLGYSATRARTMVTNKVIHQSGLLERVETEEGSARRVNRPLYRDPVGGEVLLQSTTNDFFDPVYSYAQPAHWFYPGMGAAYRTSKLAYAGSVPPGQEGDGMTISRAELGTLANLISVGDEFDVTASSGIASTAVISAIGTDDVTFRVAGTVPDGPYSLMLARPHARNQIGLMAGEVRALANPLDPTNRSQFACTNKEEVPCGEACYRKIKHKKPSQAVADALLKVGIQPGNIGAKRDKAGRIKPVSQKVEFTNVTIRSGRIVATRGSVSCFLAFYAGDGTLVDAARIRRVVSWNERKGPAGKPLDGATDARLIAVVETRDGSRIETRVYSTCPGIVETVTEVVSQPEYCESTQTTPLTVIPHVLNARATEFSDDWLEARDEIQLLAEPARDKLEARDPFLNGKRGNWRAEKIHEFVAPRGPTRASLPMNRRTDGAVDRMIMFSWTNPEAIAQCVKDWKLTRIVTRYSPYGYELENQNAIGLQSSALYGYRASMPTAVAVNASQDEIGFDGFEEYPDGQINVIAPPPGNLLFGTVAPGIINLSDVHVRVEVVNGLICGNFARLQNRTDALKSPKGLTASRSALYPNTLDELRTASKSAFISMSLPGISCPRQVENVIFASQYPDEPILVAGPPIDGCDFGGGTRDPSIPERDPDLKQCVNWTPGKVEIVVVVGKGKGDPAPPAPMVTSTKAHTGKKSLRVSQNSEDFQQHYLKVIPGKTYQLSGWVSRDDVDAPTLRSPETLPATERMGFRVSYLDGAGNKLGEVLLEPLGAVVEGWQQVVGAIEPMDGTAFIAIGLQSGKQRIGLQDVVKPAYFDDLRFFPEKGNIETYVYDPRDFRLRASLDKNNFATLYSYDAEGRLFLVRKETVRGIETVRETRTNLRERAPGTP
jgi:hypothetical protein